MNEGKRQVFVGNIPYGVTEELITETFSRVGQVLNFRLLYDKETGKPKGFGFLEFADADQAASAVRNMNDHELNGRRLRVDFANESDRTDKHSSSQSAPAQNIEVNGQEAGNLPLPTGADLAPNQSAEEAVAKTLSTLPPNQLLDIISQMKGLVQTDPAKATGLLTQAPQLAYAIFQALLLLRLVDTNVLNSIIQHAAAQPAPPQPPAQPPQPAYQPYQPQPQYGGNVPTPPVAPPYQPPPQAAPAPPAVPTDQGALIQQVLTMPQSVIDALPPEQRAQIMQLRQQFATQYPR